MQTNIFNCGVDVGNSDIKTSNTSTPSGLSVFSKVPFGAEEWLEYNGVIYVPSDSRFPYVKDKTVNDNCFILTLFGIAKEFINTLEKRKVSELHMQDYISSMNIVNLGVGLPPAHCSTLSEKLIKYYRSGFGEGITFHYKKLKFTIKLGLCFVYPQDFAAIATYKHREDSIPKSFPKYVAIDIGAYTVDVVPISKGKPDVANCDSRELGIFRMYEEIMRRVEKETGTVLTPIDIESVLKKENNLLSNTDVELIMSITQEWVDKIINTIKQSGIEFATTPVVFLGGGSLLLKRFIKKNPLLVKIEFMSNANSNAEGFRKLIVAQANRS